MKLCCDAILLEQVVSGFFSSTRPVRRITGEMGHLSPIENDRPQVMSHKIAFPVQFMFWGLSKATWKSVNIHECLMNAYAKLSTVGLPPKSVDVSPPYS